MPSPPHPRAAADDRQAFVCGLLVDFRRQTAAALRGRPADPNSLCNAALVRVLGAMYRAFDRERDNAASFCRRAFAVAVRDELVERVRRDAALKRGGGFRRQPFDPDAAAAAPHDPLTDLNDAIDQIRRTRPLRADVVVLRVYGGFTFREIAAECGVDESTARKQFKLAQVQLWRLFGPRGEP